MGREQGRALGPSGQQAGSGAGWLAGWLTFQICSAFQDAGPRCLQALHAFISKTLETELCMGTVLKYARSNLAVNLINIVSIFFYPNRKYH